MNPKRNMAIIIPKILWNRQAPIRGEIRRDIRSVEIRAEAGRVFDSPVLRVVEDAGEEGMRVEE